ncbi:hypothetical protein DM860_014698 [Cuscuta australis]|uniref:Bromo domain-containing protein n=1 Tax=Cuscuta australis TaxID=267555 RepID=A0A328DKX4_9ASTE|nr:hypothetical protein DM860_014698 [Cuscuta australis]
MLGDGGGGIGRHQGSDQKPELGDKVYTRKSFKGLKTGKNGVNLTEELQIQTPAEPPVNSLPDAPMEGSSSLNRTSTVPLASRGLLDGFEGGKLGLSKQENSVTIRLSSLKSKREMRELRRKLQSELDVIRSLVKNIETKETQQNDPTRPLHQLSVSVLENSHAVCDDTDKDKRTPKANQFYRKSDFLLAKDKIPPPESNKKTKANKNTGNGFGSGKSPSQVFKSCCVLLERLMKHKHGWVFNQPVDTVGLGLHDYYDIIKHPMDLGTVKSRLDSNWYKSPREFAEDVRLTFNNAMTYNPKGQDVHVMAELLLQIFENKWALIEAEICPPTPASRKGPKLPNSETRKVLSRSESMTTPKLKPANHLNTGRVAAPKKPKAKDPDKRDMTYEEKQKLSMNLQNLPSEKLESVVQIIRKRNSSLCQQDDEIEVDIDSVDIETLWELDRFVTNFKKSLSKNKRKIEMSELATQSVKGAKQNVLQKKDAPVAGETPTGGLNNSLTEGRAERNDMSSAPEGEKLENNATKSHISNPDSGSSSSEFHSESSSEGGSDTERSPKN